MFPFSLPVYLTHPLTKRGTLSFRFNKGHHINRIRIVANYGSRKEKMAGGKGSFFSPLDLTIKRYVPSGHGQRSRSTFKSV